MPKPSSATIVQIVRVAGSRSMRAEIMPALKASAPLPFMFSRLPVACGAGLSLLDRPVDAQGAAAREGEIEEDEAEQNRQLPLVHDRIERARRMRHEIGEGHFAREDERHDPGEGADEEQGGADCLKKRCK